VLDSPERNPELISKKIGKQRRDANIKGQYDVKAPVDNKEGMLL
jgi:hypothetical protein